MNAPGFAPELCHAPLLHAAPKVLSFANSFKPQFNCEFMVWRAAVEARLRELVGTMPARCDLNLRVEWRREHPEWEEIRFLFTAEPNAYVPCHLLLPKNGTSPYPTVICLQGHSSGMHISLGRAQTEADAQSIEGDRNFAIQAVREGYAALVIEQRCFGERRDARDASKRHLSSTCHHASMAALLLGRTMIGERVWDVSRAIDALEHIQARSIASVDTSRIGCMGNSGGGTITYFAACLEPRISIAMPSCSVCTFADSIGSIDHCADNYVPGILKYFEMGDLSCLIAPRPLLAVTGRHDAIFPIDAVQSTFRLIQEVYAASGAPDNCRLVIGEAGHRFYADQSWLVFRELSRW